MKKSMKKFMIACAAVSSIAIAAGMSAMAADISSQYVAEGQNANSIPIATPAEAADGTQMTVLVVPTDKKSSVTDADILYIDQNEKGKLPATALLKGESLGDGTYSVLVGYYNAAGTFNIAEDTFTIGTPSTGTEVLVGDVDGSGQVRASDASAILVFLAEEEGIEANTANFYAASSCEVDYKKITAADASAILVYLAEEDSETVNKKITVDLK